MVRRFIYILSLLIAISQSVGAETLLTLERCREMALESNYNLKSAVERVSVAEDVLAAYKTNNLPNFSLSGNYLYSTSTLALSIPGGYLPIVSGGEVSADSFAYMPDQNYDLEVGSVYNVGAMVTQPIYMGGKVSNAIKLARVGVEVSNLERRLSETTVVELADNAFYKLLEVEEMLQSAQKYEVVVEEFHRQMQSALAHGMKTRNEVMKVGVRLNEAKLLRLKAENGVRLARMNLCYVVGLPLSTSDVSLVEPTFEEGAVDSSDLDVTSRAEYAMLSSQISAKELEAKISKGEFLPSVSAVGSYSYTNGVTVNDMTLLNSASFMGGVMVNVPLFHWGEGRRKTSAKQREVTIAQNQMEDLRMLMTLELLQAINAYNESLLEVELSIEATTEAAENMRLSKNQYDAGMETIADYLESQALWQKSMSDLCSARAAQRAAYTQYLKCCGEL